MKLRLDRLFPAVLCLALGFALVNLYSASQGGGYFYKQLIWIGLSTVAALLAAFVPPVLWSRLAPWIWFGVVVLLLAVLFWGPVVNGSRRWLSLGGVRLQPSEFAKVAVVLILARLMSRAKRGHELWGVMELLALWNPSRPLALLALLVMRGELLGPWYWPLAILALLWVFGSATQLVSNGTSGRWIAPVDTLIIPFVLVNIEPDLGTSLVVLSCGIGVFWGAGVRAPTFRALLAALPVLVSAAWGAWSFLLLPYQKLRILGVLDSQAHAQGAGYHTIQSVHAIANGSIFGRGFGVGAQSQGQRLPEHHTDFIFAVLVEEWGLVGGGVALLLLLTLIYLIVDGARHTSSRFLELSAYGTATLIAVQTLVNVGMVSGILPVVGMTLPLFSYGGSSLLSLSFLLGLSLRARSGSVA